MLLLRTLLQMPELRLSLHTGEDQLDRTVTRVYGTELPDPSPRCGKLGGFGFARAPRPSHWAGTSRRRREIPMIVCLHR